MQQRRTVSTADQVWNRACSGEGRSLQDGDRALTALLLVHGYIQNGGVEHARDLTAKELSDGLAGFRYFGLEEIATLIEGLSGQKADELNRRYYRDAQSIRPKFEEMLKAHPARFAPVNG